jgi:hypothetical protein
MLKKILLKLTVEGDLYKLRGDGSSPTLAGFFRASKGEAVFWKVRTKRSDYVYLSTEPGR